MKTVQFKELHKMEFDLHKIIIIHHFWQDGEIFPMEDAVIRCEEDVLLLHW